MKTKFTVQFRNKIGGFAEKELSCRTGETPELTFKAALKSLPKYICKTWEGLSFIQNDYTFSIYKYHLEETNFDFSKACTIKEISIKS